MWKCCGYSIFHLLIFHLLTIILEKFEHNFHQKFKNLWKKSTTFFFPYIFFKILLHPYVSFNFSPRFLAWGWLGSLIQTSKWLGSRCVRRLYYPIVVGLVAYIRSYKLDLRILSKLKTWNFCLKDRTKVTPYRNHLNSKKNFGSFNIIISNEI